MIDSKEEFYDFFTPKNSAKPEIHGGFALAHWNGSREVEEQIKSDLKVRSADSFWRRRAGQVHFHRRTEPAPRGLGEVRIDANNRCLFISALSMELKLYSREWCSWCMDAKEYLTERGYQFREIDVGEDRQAYQEMKELSDQTYVPTFVAGDKVLANFDTDQLEEFLREHEIKP